jgi:glucose-6-phosphate 1-dehydrogenase
MMNDRLSCLVLIVYLSGVYPIVYSLILFSLLLFALTVLRMQPSEAVYMKTNVKSPGFTAKPVQSELEVNYDTRFYADKNVSNPDAYTRLILDVLQGRHGAFVRDDELRRAWEIFTPILHQIENENIQPIVYKQGSRGPVEADTFMLEQAGYVRNEDYVFHETKL